jgi:hypothetical protein
VEERCRQSTEWDETSKEGEVKKLIAGALVAGAVLAGPGVANADAAISPKRAEIKAENAVRHDVFKWSGYMMFFKVDCDRMLPRTWDCEWTGRRGGWRHDGFGYATVMPNGGVHNVVSTEVD